MSIPVSECGAVILSGGRSSRMGTCKALLTLHGQTMIQHLSAQLQMFDECILSTNTPELASGLPLIPVADIYCGAGPAAGLHAALSVTTKKALFCLPCDLPFFSEKLVWLLLDACPPQADAIICRDGQGRIHPLCGIYSKTVLAYLTNRLESGRYKMLEFLEEIPCFLLDTGGIISDNVFFNMNTPRDFFLAATNQ